MELAAWGGTVMLSRHNSPAYFVYRRMVFAKAYPRFWHALILRRFQEIHQAASRRSSQQAPSVPDSLYRTLCSHPSPNSAAIVRYLDYVDRRIRRYVAAKRKLIALLEEEKQAVINQAVTRGLDPNVRLKPSGVEWLGDVPEHWEVRRLKHGQSIQEHSEWRTGTMTYSLYRVPLQSKALLSRGTSLCFALSPKRRFEWTGWLGALSLAA